jgi:hypothetical protein
VTAVTSLEQLVTAAVGLLQVIVTIPNGQRIMDSAAGDQLITLSVARLKELVIPTVSRDYAKLALGEREGTGDKELLDPFLVDGIERHQVRMSQKEGDVGEKFDRTPRTR